MSLWVCQDCKALTSGSGGELRCASCGSLNVVWADLTTASVPHCPRCAELQADVARLTALLHRVVMLLDASSCYSCGAEPGCNIDCGLCHLTAELQREGLAPKEDKS